MTAGRRAADDGFVGGMDAVVVGMLVFVVSLLVVANAWAVVDAKLAVEAAAREATRAYVEDTTGDAAWASAVAAAEQTVLGHGRDPRRMTIAPVGEVRLARCAEVHLRISYPVRIFPLSVLGRGGRVIDVAGVHRERVDAHRSGLAGAAPC